MRKLQVLFPGPTMERLRRLARHEDRPVSELVRKAVDRLLEQTPGTGPAETPRPTFPTFHGGRIGTTAREMKSVLYEDDDA